MTDDYLQRLPDSLEMDNSRDHNLSDEEERMSMFMSCDINTLFD